MPPLPGQNWSWRLFFAWWHYLCLFLLPRLWLILNSQIYGIWNVKWPSCHRVVGQVGDGETLRGDRAARRMLSRRWDSFQFMICGHVRSPIPAQIDHKKTAICRPKTLSTRVLIWCLQAGNSNSGMNPIRPIAEKNPICFTNSSSLLIHWVNLSCPRSSWLHWLPLDGRRSFCVTL